MNNRPWAELLQLVPIITLALPFILAGQVDLNQAKGSFVVAAVLSAIIFWVINKAGQLQNPISVGTGVWLLTGALAFQIPIVPVASWLSETQAFGIFVAALISGGAYLQLSPHGYLACGSCDANWTRRGSLVLLTVNIACIVWAWVFRDDIRLGGGLPFIVLNVTRRVLCVRAPQGTSASVQKTT